MTPNPERSAAAHAGCPAEIAAAAGFFFAVKPMITLIVVRGLGLSPQVGSGLRLIASGVLLAFTALAFLSSASRPRHRPTSVKWAWGFVVLAGLSFSWGQAASPLVSMAYWLGTICEFGAALVLTSTAAVEQVAAAIMKGFVGGALLVAFIAWVMPPQYDLRLGDEEYFNANNIALICAFGAFFAQYLMRSVRGPWEWALLMLTMTVFRSLSKTTIAAFLVSEAWLLIRDPSTDRKTRATLAGGGFLLLSLFSRLFVSYFDIYTNYGNQADTLTGRTAIWAWTFSEGLERPWLGHGFDAMWKVAPLFGTFEARHAENEWLQQFYSFGLVGVIVTAGYYLSVWRALRKPVKEPRRMVLTALLMFIAVRGLAEAEPFDLLLPLWMLALLVSLADAWTIMSNRERVPQGASSQ